jgi:hypothetical protein
MVLAALGAAAEPPTPPQPPDPVRIVSQSARWAGLLGPDELSDERVSVFVISGEVENVGPAPIAFIKLAFELIRDGAEGESIVANEYGYNLRAEALRDPALEAGDPRATPPSIRPLAPGERDLFRMTFFRQDVPHFERWRVRILTAATAAAAPTRRPVHEGD